MAMSYILKGSQKHYLMQSASRFTNKLHCLRYTTPCVIKPQKFEIPLDLMESIEHKAHDSKTLLCQLKKQSNSKIASVTVQTALGGMRGAQVLVCETSAVDPYKGLSYRGCPLSDIISKLPSFHKSHGVIEGSKDTYPMSESLLWFLLTGSLPTTHQVDQLRKIIVSRMKLPEHAISAIRSLPTTTHPMTQFITGIVACQTESIFSPLYTTGQMTKNEFWKYALDDGLTLMAKLPALAAWIYRRISVRPELSLVVPTPNTQIDWAGNIAQMLGYPSKDMEDVIRLYMFLHADHEGGNVSAHAGHLVASALADPYLSFAASMTGLAAPLHGLANQQCLDFYRNMLNDLKKDQHAITKDSVKKYVENYLNKGQVIPGFGHAVLRVTDPRFTIQKQFAEKVMPTNELFQLLKNTIEVIPPILSATGKVKNPWPNVDAHSGIILNHFGLQEEMYFTVLFGLSRCIGIISQIVWDRLLNLPIERPKSITLKQLHEMIQLEH